MHSEPLNHHCVYVCCFGQGSGTPRPDARSTLQEPGGMTAFEDFRMRGA